MTPNWPELGEREPNLIPRRDDPGARIPNAPLVLYEDKDTGETWWCWDGNPDCLGVISVDDTCAKALWRDAAVRWLAHELACGDDPPDIRDLIRFALLCPSEEVLYPTCVSVLDARSKTGS